MAVSSIEQCAKDSVSKIESLGEMIGNGPVMNASALAPISLFVRFRLPFFAAAMQSFLKLLPSKRALKKKKNPAFAAGVGSLHKAILTGAKATAAALQALDSALKAAHPYRGNAALDAGDDTTAPQSHIPVFNTKEFATLRRLVESFRNKSFAKSIDEVSKIISGAAICLESLK